MLKKKTQQPLCCPSCSSSPFYAMVQANDVVNVTLFFDEWTRCTDVIALDMMEKLFNSNDPNNKFNNFESLKYILLYKRHLIFFEIDFFIYYAIQSIFDSLKMWNVCSILYFFSLNYFKPFWEIG